MTTRLVILYGIGGLSDVGRHAIQAALKVPSVESIRVLTQHPELLQLPNWKCGCPTPHSFSEQEKKCIQVIPVKDWNDKEENLKLWPHFQGAQAVISCLGNRQPGISETELKKGWVATDGNNMVIRALLQQQQQKEKDDKRSGGGGQETTTTTLAAPCRRVVAVTSVGVEEDWPPMEFFWIAKVILGALFVIHGLARRAFWDLTYMERAYKGTKSDEIDYLLVRPVGLGDDVVPVGTWQLQKEKYKDTVGMDMAKLDCARYMVQEALNPTKHRTAVVIGAVEQEKEKEA